LNSGDTISISMSGRPRHCDVCRSRSRGDAPRSLRAALACSPKVDPVGMRVSTAQEPGGHHTCPLGCGHAAKPADGGRSVFLRESGVAARVGGASAEVWALNRGGCHPRIGPRHTRPDAMLRVKTGLLQRAAREDGPESFQRSERLGDPTHRGLRARRPRRGPSRGPARRTPELSPLPGQRLPPQAARGGDGSPRPPS
jgi:hypothetical protein